MNFQVNGYPKVGQTCQAEFSFQNPLNSSLNNCSFSVEGPGLQRPKVVRYRSVQIIILLSIPYNKGLPTFTVLINESNKYS